MTTSYTAIKSLHDTTGEVDLNVFKSSIYDDMGNRLAECYDHGIAEKLVAVLNKDSE